MASVNGNFKMYFRVEQKTATGKLAYSFENLSSKQLPISPSNCHTKACQMIAIECIPVGCVPPAAVAIRGGLHQVPPLRTRPPPGPGTTPGTRKPPLLQGRHPWDQAPPWSRHPSWDQAPQSRHPPGPGSPLGPGNCPPPGQIPPRTRHPPPGPGTPEQTPPRARHPPEQTPPRPGTPKTRHPLPVDRMTDTCKNITFANFVCGR